MISQSKKTKPICEKAQINANSLVIKDYENKWQRTVRKNKANQSQLVKTGTRPKIQILSLKSGVWKEGRKVREVDFLYGQRKLSG